MSKAAATSDSNFQHDVLDNPLPVLVDFWADWCGPCRMLAPTIDQIAEDLTGKLQVFKMDVDANPRVAGQFGIQGIPTLILFSGGQPRGQVVGVRSKTDLLQEIEKAVGVTP
jgi:thioredoxin 1